MPPPHPTTIATRASAANPVFIRWSPVLIGAEPRGSSPKLPESKQLAALRGLCNPYRVFPSMKGSQLLRILLRKPLSYEVVRQSGSHRRLESPNGYPPLTFSFRDSATVAPGLVRKILVKDIGLDEQEALELL